MKTLRNDLATRDQLLRSYEGIPFSEVPFEVLQPLSSPCDLYSLGVLALRLLYAGSVLTLPVILDTALSLLRAATAEPSETSLEARILNLLETDERWLETLGLTITAPGKMSVDG